MHFLTTMITNNNKNINTKKIKKIKKSLLFPLISIAFMLNIPHSISEAIPLNPEDSTGFNIKPLVSTKKNMIVTANPFATDAGVSIMKQGGNAVDALIAAQLVLGLTEPQSSGIGGGAFAVMYHNKTQNISAWDGRESAPHKATDAIFKKTDGSIAGFYDIVPTGRSVGVPGVMKMLWQLHQKYGVLPWKQLFQPAIKLARIGFVVSSRLATMIANEKYFSKEAKNYFYDEQSKPRKAGDILKNHAYAHTLEVLSQQGIDGFYNSTDSNGIGADIIDTVKRYGGTLEGEDLINYSVKNRAVKCQEYRQYQVCGSDFPSGATTVLEILALLSHFDLSIFNPKMTNISNNQNNYSNHKKVSSINDNLNEKIQSLYLLVPSQAIHLFSEAGKIAYADRNQYASDPDFNPITNELLNQEYIKVRKKEIQNKSQGIAKAGIFDTLEQKKGADTTLEVPGTSHISVVDGFGNAVSMTTSVEDKFGSRLFVRGFLLNNTLSDFSFTSKDKDGSMIYNRIEGGKRPRSAMSPVLVFNQNFNNLTINKKSKMIANKKQIEQSEVIKNPKLGQLYAVLGAPGGSLIINYVVQSLISLLDWDLNPQQIVHLPHFGSRNNINNATELEDWNKFNSSDVATQSLITTQQEHFKTIKEELEDKNHIVQLIEQPSGLSIISRDILNKGWQGSADPRREGSAGGE
jgi:gamma-glutamyltranspeptidase/glutathione hydrolase